MGEIKMTLYMKTITYKDINLICLLKQIPMYLLSLFTLFFLDITAFNKMTIIFLFNVIPFRWISAYLPLSFIFVKNRNGINLVFVYLCMHQWIEAL